MMMENHRNKKESILASIGEHNTKRIESEQEPENTKYKGLIWASTGKGSGRVPGKGRIWTSSRKVEI